MPLFRCRSNDGFGCPPRPSNSLTMRSLSHASTRSPSSPHRVFSSITRPLLSNTFFARRAIMQSFSGSPRASTQLAPQVPVLRGLPRPWATNRITSAESAASNGRRTFFSVSLTYLLSTAAGRSSNGSLAEEAAPLEASGVLSQQNRALVANGIANDAWMCDPPHLDTTAYRSRSKRTPCAAMTAARPGRTAQKVDQSPLGK